MLKEEGRCWKRRQHILLFLHYLVSPCVSFSPLFVFIHLKNVTLLFFLRSLPHFLSNYILFFLILSTVYLVYPSTSLPSHSSLLLTVIPSHFSLLSLFFVIFILLRVVLCLLSFFSSVLPSPSHNNPSSLSPAPNFSPTTSILPPLFSPTIFLPLPLMYLFLDASPLHFSSNESSKRPSIR